MGQILDRDLGRNFPTVYQSAFLVEGEHWLHICGTVAGVAPALGSARLRSRLCVLTGGFGCVAVLLLLGLNNLLHWM